MTIQVNKIYSYQTLVYKNGNRTFRKKHYNEYSQEIRSQLDNIVYEGDLDVTIAFHCVNRVVGDLDNIAKPIFDILQEHGTIKNDKYITKMTLTKSFGHTKNEIVIKIKEDNNERKRLVRIRRKRVR